MAQAAKVLVVFGVPPNHIQLFSAGGKRLHKDWKFDAKTFGGAQQKNFEAKLVIERQPLHHFRPSKP